MSFYRGLTSFDFRQPIRVDYNQFDLLGELSEVEEQSRCYSKEELLRLRPLAPAASPEFLAKIKAAFQDSVVASAPLRVHHARTHGHKHKRDCSYHRQSPVDKHQKIEEWFQRRKENQDPAKK